MVSLFRAKHKSKKVETALAPAPDGTQLLFDTVLLLLDNLDEWKMSEFTLKHLSGLELWIANRGLTDGDVQRPYKVAFTEEKRMAIRAKMDKVRKHLMMLDPESSTSMEVAGCLVAVRDWGQATGKDLGGVL